MKVLFCFNPIYGYNHGAALLSSLCKERGIKTAQYRLDTLERFTAHIKATHYDFISFSLVYDYDYTVTLPYIEEAKRQNKVVLVGGVHMRLDPEEANPPADFICYGEGETLPDFLLNGDDRLFREKMLCEDLNALPLPDYNMLLERYKDPGALIPGLFTVPYFTVRGCPWQCSFCVVRRQPQRIRLRTRVKEDLEYLLKTYKPDAFLISGETLPYYNQKWRESWEDFRYPFGGMIRADIEPEQLEWLHDRGLKKCSFGVESGDERFRNEVLKKDLTDEQIFRTVEILKRLGIGYDVFYMHSVTGSNFEEKAKTYRMAKAVGGNAMFFGYAPLVPGVGKAINPVAYTPGS